MHHDLKIWLQYFCRVADGSKTFEVRENDRGFQPGDAVTLREWDKAKAHINYSEGSGYSGKCLDFKIGYVFPIDDKRVVFSLLPIDGGKC